jgi:hypothetical protein
LGQAPLLLPPPEDANLAGKGEVGGRNEADGLVCAGPAAVAAVAAAGKRVSAICTESARECERETERGGGGKRQSARGEREREREAAVCSGG